KWRGVRTTVSAGGLLRDSNGHRDRRITRRRCVGTRRAWEKSHPMSLGGDWPGAYKIRYAIAAVGARLLDAGTDRSRSPLGENLARGCASPRRHPSSGTARPRQLHLDLAALR